MRSGDPSRLFLIKPSQFSSSLLLTFSWILGHPKVPLSSGALGLLVYNKLTGLSSYSHFSRALYFFPGSKLATETKTRCFLAPEKSRPHLFLLGVNVAHFPPLLPFSSPSHLLFLLLSFSITLFLSLLLAFPPPSSILLPLYSPPPPLTKHTH